MSSIHTILKQYFGYDSFRGVQQAVIESVLAGNDTLALLPTGGGKSICYQVPALALDGICLVVTPLIALMKDQARQLIKRNISTLVMHSGLSFFEVKKTLENASSGNFKFLFVSPERLQTSLFKEYLPGIPISLLAVDEAHCISQWGYDFRPPYLSIADIRQEKPDLNVVALTASATKQVQEDIMRKLAFSNGKLFRQSFERANLSFSSFFLAEKSTKMLKVLDNVKGSALVYCRNRRLTKDIAAFLNSNHIAAGYYHAGLSTEERNTKQDNWTKNIMPVMACTNAFGMGIDKPDVRVVIHHDLPEGLEYYYQEAGRAGRDGKKAYAVLLYNQSDLERLNDAVKQKFPPLSLVRKVYEDLCNYLVIPIGSGEGEYFTADLETFCTRFKQQTYQVLAALKILEQSGYINFSDHLQLRSKVGFLCDKETLYQIEEGHPQWDILIKTLLRTYEGIFGHQVFISEKQVAGLMKATEEEIVSKLEKLADAKLISYSAKTNKPQVFFHTDRVPAADLYFDEIFLANQKKTWQKRINDMIAYAGEKHKCRSTIIREYFGDDKVRPCGICDNCLKKQNEALATNMHDLSVTLLRSLPHSAETNALKKLLGTGEKNVMLLIDFLLAEERIVVEDNCIYHLPPKSH